MEASKCSFWEEFILMNFKNMKTACSSQQCKNNKDDSFNSVPRVTRNVQAKSFQDRFTTCRSTLWILRELKGYESSRSKKAEERQARTLFKDKRDCKPNP